ncbi:MAG: hypothetical protein WC435_02495 [Candidatus Paceibacterota bacterium]
MAELQDLASLSNEILVKRLMEVVSACKVARVEGFVGVSRLEYGLMEKNKNELEAEVLRRLEEAEELKSHSKPSFSGIPYEVALEAGMIATEMREFEEL